MNRAIEHLRKSPFYEEIHSKYETWYERYTRWLDGQAAAPARIAFNKDNEKWEHIRYLLHMLGIPEPKFKEGWLVPQKDEHGYVIEIKCENDEVRHRYLVCYASGQRPKPVSAAPRHVYKNSRQGELYLLLAGYGPADLCCALKEVKITLIKKGGINKESIIMLTVSPQGRQIFITVPRKYARCYIKPDISGEDISNSAQTHVTLYDIFKNTPVIEVIIRKRGKTWEWEENRVGEYYDPRDSGYRYWSSMQWARYLTGRRKTPPYEDTVPTACKRLKLLHTTVIGRKDRCPYERVQQCALRVSKSSTPLLGLWAPDVDPSKTHPLKVFKMVGGLLVKVPIPKKYEVLISMSQARTALPIPARESQSSILRPNAYKETERDRVPLRRTVRTVPERRTVPTLQDEKQREFQRSI